MMDGQVEADEETQRAVAYAMRHSSRYVSNNLDAYIIIMTSM